MSDDQLSGKWPAVELPEAWVWTKFSDFWSDYTDTKKKIPQKQYLPEGQFAVVDQGEALIGGYTNDKELLSNAPVPSIVFGDHTRAVKFVEVPFAQGADGVRVLGTPSGIEPRFAYQALRAVDLPNKGYSRHFKFLKATEFPLPPLAEQKRIVAKLDALSARSARARKDLARIDTLVKRYKQAVLSKAFSGELTKDWHGKSTASPSLGSIDGILEVPIRNGLSVKGSDTPPGVRALKLSALRGQSVNMSDVRYLPIDDERARRFLLESGDILVSRGNGTKELVGISSLVPPHNEPTIFPDTAFRIRVNIQRALPYWLTYIWNAPQCRSQIEKAAKTTAGIWKISQKDLSGIELLIPSCEEQKEIIRRIEGMFHKIDLLAAEAKRALDLTDKLDEAILAKAFRGDLVPQDPNDEPASVLLERIKTERAAAPKPKRGRRKKS
ncbi:type I restriction endonuclease subunit S [Labrenzia sp. 5N]|uniref:restriction endonuclease subunit S n=1 Tax=Labrenzia sp. 5N TaxID=2723402 RepID=UPI001445BF23|nr:restriction endonuclease subunit S [Labrenzia sp. 5N]NKX63735.1 type I restriction endonuclease subunit S [Labrenzia sp. 5N]